MKSALAVIMLMAFMGAGLSQPACGAPGGVRSVSLSGKNYVSLAEWARANGFGARWIRNEPTLQLTNRTARLVFGLEPRDLRFSEINGINVYLCFPIILSNGTAYISELDLKETINPLLHPPKNRSGSKIRTIVLDPGHGGNDPGKEDGSRKEKAYTLLLAQELCDQLKHAGFKASLTRTTDEKIELPVRPDIARRRGADLFLSLHWNSFGTGKNEINGAETYCLTPAGAPSSNAGGEVIGAGPKPGNLYNDKNIFLAYMIQKALQRNLSVEDRGVHRARYAVLRTAEMPAVLIEGGFMSNPAESKRIYDPAFRRQMARAIVEAIQTYQSQVEVRR